MNITKKASRLSDACWIVVDTFLYIIMIAASARILWSFTDTPLRILNSLTIINDKLFFIGVMVAVVYTLGSFIIWCGKNLVKTIKRSKE
jgi:hypothetical protein